MHSEFDTGETVLAVVSSVASLVLTVLYGYVLGVDHSQQHDISHHKQAASHAGGPAARYEHAGNADPVTTRVVNISPKKPPPLASALSHRELPKSRGYTWYASRIGLVSCFILIIISVDNASVFGLFDIGVAGHYAFINTLLPYFPNTGILSIGCTKLYFWLKVLYAFLKQGVPTGVTALTFAPPVLYGVVSLPLLLATITDRDRFYAVYVLWLAVIAVLFCVSTLLQYYLIHIRFTNHITEMSRSNPGLDMTYLRVNLRHTLILVLVAIPAGLIVAGGLFSVYLDTTRRGSRYDEPKVVGSSTQPLTCVLNIAPFVFLSLALYSVWPFQQPQQHQSAAAAKTDHPTTLGAIPAPVGTGTGTGNQTGRSSVVIVIATPKGGAASDRNHSPHPPHTSPTNATAPLLVRPSIIASN